VARPLAGRGPCRSAATTTVGLPTVTRPSSHAGTPSKHPRGTPTARIFQNQPAAAAPHRRCGEAIGLGAQIASPTGSTLSIRCVIDGELGASPIAALGVLVSAVPVTAGSHCSF
jgi:hypothetical protein